MQRQSLGKFTGQNKATSVQRVLESRCLLQHECCSPRPLANVMSKPCCQLPAEGQCACGSKRAQWARSTRAMGKPSSTRERPHKTLNPQAAWSCHFHTLSWRALHWQTARSESSHCSKAVDFTAFWWQGAKGGDATDTHVTIRGMSGDIAEWRWAPASGCVV